MITEKELEIYGKLFDVTKENMEAAGGVMEPEKSAFLASVHTKQHCVDILRLSKLNKRSIVQAAYSAMFSRFTDPGSIQVWKDRESMPEFEYKQTLIEGLRNSEELKMKQVSVKNNIYSKGKSVEITTAVRTGYSGVDKLYAVYAKMPGWLKRLAKRILK